VRDYDCQSRDGNESKRGKDPSKLRNMGNKVGRPTLKPKELLEAQEGTRCTCSLTRLIAVILQLSVAPSSGTLLCIFVCHFELDSP